MNSVLTAIACKHKQSVLVTFAKSTKREESSRGARGDAAGGGLDAEVRARVARARARAGGGGGAGPAERQERVRELGVIALVAVAREHLADKLADAHLLRDAQLDRAPLEARLVVVHVQYPARHEARHVDHSRNVEH